MAVKVLKNTTTSDIEFFEIGQTLPASGQLTVEPTNYGLLSLPDSISELTPLINSGDVVVNDGVEDLSPADALKYISWPDEAFDIRFLSNPDRNNGFLAKDVQTAVEEAKFGGYQFNEFDAGVFLTDRNLKAYNSASGQVINSSPSTLQINTLDPESDSTAYQLSSGEVEFLFDGKCQVIYTVVFDNSNNSRSNTQSFLEINTGSGFSKVQASDVFTYERRSNADRSSGTRAVTLEVFTGDILRIRSQVIQGSNNTSAAEGSGIEVVPLVPRSHEPRLGIDGSDLSQDEILGELDAGEL
jgi:hypothetical protein